MRTILIICLLVVIGILVFIIDDLTSRIEDYKLQEKEIKDLMRESWEQGYHLGAVNVQANKDCLYSDPAHWFDSIDFEHNVLNKLK